MPTSRLSFGRTEQIGSRKDANPIDGSSDLSRHIEVVARALLGEPNNRHRSNNKEMRFGTRGSLCVDLEMGTFYSHEDQVGGGVLDLIRREKGFKPKAAIEWMRDLGLEVNNVQRKTRRIAAVYEYVDERGDLLFQVVRFAPKDFRQRRPDGAGGWLWSVNGVRQVPYRLPWLIEARSQDRPVVVVESEKDADALAEWGIAATCNAGGAGKWRAEISPFFRGADVVIIPDRDPGPKFTGQRHAHDVASKLQGVAARVRILELPGHGKDAWDWISSGGTTNEFWRLVEAEAKPQHRLRIATRQQYPVVNFFSVAMRYESSSVSRRPLAVQAKPPSRWPKLSPL
jgi:hypothetical protein